MSHQEGQVISEDDLWGYEERMNEIHEAKAKLDEKARNSLKDYVNTVFRSAVLTAIFTIFGPLLIPGVCDKPAVIGCGLGIVCVFFFIFNGLFFRDTSKNLDTIFSTGLSAIEDKWLVLFFDLREQGIVTEEDELAIFEGIVGRKVVSIWIVGNRNVPEYVPTINHEPLTHQDILRKEVVNPKNILPIVYYKTYYNILLYLFLGSIVGVCLLSVAVYKESCK